MICPCTKRHSPPALVVHVHHVVPQSWGGTDTSPASIGAGQNTIAVCAQTHYTVHEILNLYVHHGGTPPDAELKKFPGYARALAAAGWANRIAGNPTPYTVTATGAH